MQNCTGRSSCVSGRKSFAMLLLGAERAWGGANEGREGLSGSRALSPAAVNPSFAFPLEFLTRIEKGCAGRELFPTGTASLFYGFTV